MFRASLIISFYNKTEWLKLLLAALERQTEKQFEVIIADDGSSSPIVEEIKKIQTSSPLNIQHLWHADNGFMKTVMLNKAILASRSPYLIFIDGDCIPHHRFVEDHLRMSKENRALAGRRVNLSEHISKSLTEEKIRKGVLERFFFLRLLRDAVTGKSKDVEKGIYIGSEFFNNLFASTTKGILGCNFSISKKDLLELNGFDERYRYPGVGEDTEIRRRIQFKGMEIFTPKFCMVQYHLWHQRLSREHEPENFVLLDETLKNKYVATPYGINRSII
ncbi:MAG: glycosyltransferase [Bacteroidia bacterium]